VVGELFVLRSDTHYALPDFDSGHRLGKQPKASRLRPEFCSSDRTPPPEPGTRGDGTARQFREPS
jgi:hypothetical protein